MRCDIDVRDGELRYRGDPPGEGSADVAVTASPAEFELARLAPAAAPVYYRLRRGRLEMSDDLRAFQPAGPQPPPDHGVLLGMIHGLPDAPGATALPGVHELTVGDRLRVGADGVSVLRRPLQPAPGARSLQRVIAQAIARCRERAPGAGCSGRRSTDTPSAPTRRDRKSTRLNSSHR